MPRNGCGGATADPAHLGRHGPEVARPGLGYLETMTDEPWPNRPWLAVMPTVAPST